MTRVTSIVCLVGLPGAGKTTLTKSLENHLSGKSLVVFVFEYDEWLTADENVALREKRQMALDRVRRTITELRAVHVNKELLLILDDNFYYRSMRYEVYRLARELGNCSFAEVLLDVPIELCIARNSSRGRRFVPVETIHRMHGLLETPNPSTHPWERFSIVVNDASSQVELERVVGLIGEAARHPVMPLSPEKAAVPQLPSEIHVADLALRKTVGRILSVCPSINKTRDSKRLASIKKDLLLGIKCGEIVLPPVDCSQDRLTIYCNHLMPYFYHEGSL